MNQDEMILPHTLEERVERLERLERDRDAAETRAVVEACEQRAHEQAARQLAKLREAQQVEFEIRTLMGKRDRLLREADDD